MIIYKDILGPGDELLSDTYKIQDVGNGLWEVDCQMINKGAENFVLDGANPSAEGEDAEDGTDGAAVERVIDLVDAFRLNEYPKLDKKAYMAEIKKYMKALTAKFKEQGKSDAEIKQFQTEAPAAVTKIAKNIADYDFYKGESMDDDSMLVLINYREDGITPYATLWKMGLKEEKV